MKETGSPRDLYFQYKSQEVEGNSFTWPGPGATSFPKLSFLNPHKCQEGVIIIPVFSKVTYQGNTASMLKLGFKSRSVKIPKCILLSVYFALLDNHETLVKHLRQEFTKDVVSLANSRPCGGNMQVSGQQKKSDKYNDRPRMGSLGPQRTKWQALPKETQERRPLINQWPLHSGSHEAWRYRGITANILW